MGIAQSPLHPLEENLPSTILTEFFWVFNPLSIYCNVGDYPAAPIVPRPVLVKSRTCCSLHTAADDVFADLIPTQPSPPTPAVLRPAAGDRSARGGTKLYAVTGVKAVQRESSNRAAMMYTCTEQRGGVCSTDSANCAANSMVLYSNRGVLHFRPGVRASGRVLCCLFCLPL